MRSSLHNLRCDRPSCRALVSTQAQLDSGSPLPTLARLGSPRFGGEGSKVRSVDAFTLIEVVVGMALMASILASSLIAFAALQKQLAYADKKIAAVAVADDLLHQFSVLQAGVPEVGRGPVAGQPRWVWQTSVVAAAAPMRVPMKVIRLAITETKDDGQIVTLAVVDVVEATQREATQ